MKTLRSLSLLSLCLAAASVSAQETPRFEISAAAFAPKTQLSGGGNFVVSDGTTSEAFAADGSIDNRARGAQLEARFRLTKRQRIEAQAYRVSDDRSYPFSYAQSATDAGSGTTYVGTADGQARLDTRFGLYSVNYGYDVVQTDRLVLTGLVGIYGARFDGDVRTSGTATLSDGTTTAVQDLGSSVSIDHDAFAPGIGMSGEYDINDQWSVRARLQGFRTQWGSFSYDGRFFNAQATVNYAITPNWTAFAGYDWFDLRLEDDFSARTNADGTTYTLQGPAEARLRVHGPVLGARYSF